MTIIKHLELSTFRYIIDYMPIYMKILKIIQTLKYFICQYLRTCSICPPNNFLIKLKLLILKQNTDFNKFVNKTSWCREISVQQGKCPLN